MIGTRPYATPPIYVPMHGAQTDNLHASWLNYFESLTQQLNQTLTPTGTLAPAVTQTEANGAAAQSQQKIIYNSTINTFQGNINGTWETFTTIPLLTPDEINEFAELHPNKVQLLYDKVNDELYVAKGAIKFKLQKA